MALPIDDIRRWSRQVRLPEIGLEGQEKLAGASVAVVGIGGLGCPAAAYLATAGIGRLGLIDDDVVDLTNLHRQPLFSEADAGRKKVEVAARRLGAMNSQLQIDQHAVRLTADNAMDLLAPYDVIVDGNDNFPTRYAVNDACVLLKKPSVYGSVLMFEGRISLFVPGEGPCYRCLYPEPPPEGTVPTCSEAGVLGALPGVIGAMQAAEAIKWLCSTGTSLAGRLLIFDMLTMRLDTITIPRSQTCAVCGDTPSITKPVAYDDTCDPSEDAVDVDEDGRITPVAAKKRLDAGEPLLILDVREPIEYEIARLPDTQLIPLGELPSRWKNELGAHKQSEILVLCHHGIRSAMAVGFLKSQGFKMVKNVEGGIERWAVEADPSIPRY